MSGYAPRTLVATPPTPPDTGDQLTVKEDMGGVFPEPPFIALVWPVGETPVDGDNSERMQVIARTRDTLNLIRPGPSIEIAAEMQIAAVEVIPTYERGTPVTVIGHWLEDDSPYFVHIRKPTGEVEQFGSATGVTNDGSNSYYTFTPDVSGLWGYRWEGVGGMLPDNFIFVDPSAVL